MDVRAALWIVTAGVVGGELVAGRGIPPAWPAALAGVLATAALAPRARPALLGPALALAALALGLARMAPIVAPGAPAGALARLGLPVRTTLVGRVAAAPVRRPGRLLLVLEAESTTQGPASGRVRLAVRTPARRWELGDRLAATVTLRHPRNFDNPGGVDTVGRLARQGIQVTGFVWDDTRLRRLPAGDPGVRATLARTRARIARAIRRALPRREGAVLRALVVGDEAGIDARLREAFTRAGVVHVLSISGLHVALVAAAAYLVLARLLLRSEALALALPVERVAAVGSLLPVAAYAALAGLAVPTVRAAVMAVAATAALVAGRRADVGRTLALAALGIALAVPGAPLDIGYQLSFVSVAAIVCAAGRFGAPRPGAGRWWTRVRMAGVVTAAATVATAPLTAFHFHQVSLAGMIANPLVIPIFGAAVVVPGLAGALVEGVAPEGAALLFRVAGWALRPGIALVERLGAPAWAAVQVPMPDAIELVLLYGLLVAVVLPAGRSRRVALALATAALLVDAGRWVAIRHDARTLRVTFLDVGQGDAAVAELPGGDVVVVDAGGFPGGDFDTGAAIVTPFLRARKIGGIAIAAMTHAHPDHAGGLASLVERERVGELWWNGAPGRGPAWARLRAAMTASGVPLRLRSAGIDVGGIAVLHPPPAARGLSANDGSLTLRLRHGRVAVLLTGDVEARAEAILLRDAARLAAAVVKVPHHGSRTSSTPAFVDAVGARVAVISVGADNRYGLPSPEVEARWAAAGACVLRTDRCGAVTVETDGRTLRVATRNPACGCPAWTAGPRYAARVSP